MIYYAMLLISLFTSLNATPLTPEQFAPIAKRVKLVIVNAEGVLLNDYRIISPLGDISVSLNAKDANAIAYAREYGIHVVVISKESLDAVKLWANSAGVEAIYEGGQDIRKLLQKIKTESQTSDKSVAFITDDEAELQELKSLCLIASPLSAPEPVKAQAQYICQQKSGDGALAALIDAIILSQSK